MQLNEYWDDIHKKYNSSYDGWLDKYLSFFSKDSLILELGCGRAYASKRLYELGYSNVVATDFSFEALKIVSEDNPNIKTMNIDITDIKLENNSIDIVVADLCLHYFDFKTTQDILKKIYNILKDNGYLIGRVNSVNDVLHIPNNSSEIEPGYYYDGTIYKKFFSKEELIELLKDFDIEYIKEEKMDRYEKPKVLIEFCVRKVKNYD